MKEKCREWMDSRHFLLEIQRFATYNEVYVSRMDKKCPPGHPEILGIPMVKKTPQKHFLDLLQVLSRFPEGASIGVVLKSLKSPVEKRTLQRRLKTLIDRGSIVSKGSGKSTRYLTRELFHPEKRPEDGISLKSTPLSLSDEGKRSLSQVSQPLKVRPHASYNFELLDGYEPNTTYYLSESMRKHLHAIGKVENNQPLTGTYSKRIFHRLLIDLSWNSSRLEGNTYSLLETERLIDKGISAEAKDAKETQMILNHESAIEYLIESAKDQNVNRFMLLNLHALLADNLLPDAACGSLRKISVGIGGSHYIPLEVPQQLEIYFERLVHTASKIKDPYEQSFFFMVHIPYLQPFEDVNKRVSRLAANIPLFRQGLCPLSFMDVPDKTYMSGLLSIYENQEIALLRDVFIWSYERSCLLYSKTQHETGEPDLFRMTHRDLIVETVARVVNEKMNQEKTIAFIQKQGESKLLSEHVKPFTTIVEREVQALHLGSIARYRIDPDAYKAWRKVWQ